MFTDLFPAMICTLLCALFGCLGLVARHLAGRYLDDEAKRSAARLSAQYVQQVCKALHGPDKLNKALEAAELLLEKKGIPFDAAEMRILIEAAVGEFNKSFAKPFGT